MKLIMVGRCRSWVNTPLPSCFHWHSQSGILLRKYSLCLNASFCVLAACQFDKTFPLNCVQTMSGFSLRFHTDFQYKPHIFHNSNRWSNTAAWEHRVSGESVLVLRYAVLSTFIYWWFLFMWGQRGVRTFWARVWRSGLLCYPLPSTSKKSSQINF